MEAHLSSTVESGLLDALSFRPGGHSADYVLQSRQVKIFAEASDTFGINSRVIRFRLTEQDFWEPGSTRIEFTLHNEDASNPLVPVASPGAMFSRYRIFVSGIQVENWDYVGETTVLMDRLKGAARRLNDSTEHHFLSNGYNDTYTPIGAGKARRVMMTLPCGIFGNKWIPLSLCSGGVTVEMELSADSGQAFTTTNTPTWSIKDVALSCTLHQIDQSLSSSYAKHILQGNSISYHTKSMVCTKHLITGSSFTLPIVRGYTRLCQVWMTMHKAAEKPILDFYSPINNASAVHDTTTDTCTMQLSIGSRRWPERPTSSVGEQFLRLRQAAGVFYGESDIAILPADFVNRKFIAAWDLEKCAHQGGISSGQNTKNGDILSVDVKNSGLGASGDYCLIYLYFDNLFSLRDGSVDVYD